MSAVFTKVPSTGLEYRRPEASDISVSQVQSALDDRVDSRSGDLLKELANNTPDGVRRQRAETVTVNVRRMVMEHKAMERRGLWASLRNDARVVAVPSGDWEHILRRYGHLSVNKEDPWCEDRGWLWTPAEAAALADALQSARAQLLVGCVMVDLNLGNGISGTTVASAEDRLTPERRALRLVAFLRQGAFHWGFVSLPTTDSAV